MSDIQEDVRNKMRRTLTHELSRMEDDFDDTRNRREVIVGRMMEVASGVRLLDDAGNTLENTPVGLQIMTTALRALADVEKANVQAINLKLKQSEQEIASSAAARDRVALMLKATAPGRIETEFPEGELEAHLAEMFDKDINDFEMKTNPKSLEEDVIE